MNPMLINAWFVSIITLLVMANNIPNAFYYALIVFYCPFVIFAFNVVFSLVPRDIWFGAGLMCLFLWTRFAILPSL